MLVDKPRILVVDDEENSREILLRRLVQDGYRCTVASNAADAGELLKREAISLMLLDVMMPNRDGSEVLRRLKDDTALPFMPIILVTAKSDTKDVVAGLEAGADEYLTKPVDQAALVARVKSMLRIKALHDQAHELAVQLSEWHEKLKERVAGQLSELERMNQLKGFFSPQVAELILTAGNEKLMESHRREITVVFCDLRRFSAFSETAEPEEIMRVLREYHKVLGPLIFRFEATLEHFAGDGLMTFFNDPVPCPDPALRAIRMAVAIRDGSGEIAELWRKYGYAFGSGGGIARGYSPRGLFSSDGRLHYGAIGSVLNLASRLCDQAHAGQILIAQRVSIDVEDMVELDAVEEFKFKGFVKPVIAFNVVGLKPTDS